MWLFSMEHLQRVNVRNNNGIIALNDDLPCPQNYYMLCILYLIYFSPQPYQGNMLSTTTKFTDKKTSSKMKISTVTVFLSFYNKKATSILSHCEFPVIPLRNAKASLKFLLLHHVSNVWGNEDWKGNVSYSCALEETLTHCFLKDFFFNSSWTHIIKKGYLKYYFEDTQNYKNLLHPRCSKFSWEHRENIK